MEFKGRPENKLNIDEQNKLNRQLIELVNRNISNEINDTLRYTIVACFLACLASINPDLLKVFRETFKQAIKTLNTPDLLSNIVGNKEEAEKIKEMVDINAIIEISAKNYTDLLDNVEKAFSSAKSGD